MKVQIKGIRTAVLKRVKIYKVIFSTELYNILLRYEKPIYLSFRSKLKKILDLCMFDFCKAFLEESY